MVAYVGFAFDSDSCQPTMPRWARKQKVKIWELMKILTGMGTISSFMVIGGHQLEAWSPKVM